MQLSLSTWPEIEAYLSHSNGIIIPTGSIEQHGPMGLIGTDALCAEAIAYGAADKAKALLAPTLTYTPAPFNLAFPGTISIPAELFGQLVDEIISSLTQQGFHHLYFLNGHGANLEPLHRCAERYHTSHSTNDSTVTCMKACTPSACKSSTYTVTIRVRSWWDFAEVNQLREQYYGDWEGMHATPSEIAITQATHRIIPAGAASEPPQKLSREYIKTRAGDKHDPPAQHRQQFPDGRVGSHSALAKPEQGAAILAAAIDAVATDYLEFIQN